MNRHHFLSRTWAFAVMAGVLVAGALLAVLAPGAEAAVLAHPAAWLSDPAAVPAIGLGGLVVNQANLAHLFTGFKTTFQKGLGRSPGQHQLVAMTVPSGGREEKYSWLGKVPAMREWIGDRVVQNLMQHDYAIKNKDWELTIGVDRNDIEDDQFGIYAPLFEAMGESTGSHPDEMVFPMLPAGFGAACYDGQYFFDTDHPVLGADGQMTSVANTDGGAGTPWYLMDLSRTLKPIIFQERKKPQFVAKDKTTDDNVFDRKQFVYGVDSRDNVGYGLWQLAWGSKQTLDSAHYAAARAALQGMKGDHGRPLGIRPTHLVVPPTLEGKALEIVNADRAAAGATNVYKGTAQVVVVPWLA